MQTPSNAHCCPPPPQAIAPGNAAAISAAPPPDAFGATVSGFGIALIMRFYPRFSTRIGHLDQLSRVERMWLHGAPLVVRLFLFSAGIFVWLGSRTA